MIKVNCFLPKALISTSSVNMKLLLLFLFMTLTLAQKGNCIICISQSIATGGKLADSWIRHVARDSLVLPAANFSSLPTSPLLGSRYPSRHIYSCESLYVCTPTCPRLSRPELPRSLRDRTNSTHLCQALRMTFSFRLGDCLPIRTKKPG